MRLRRSCLRLRLLIRPRRASRRERSAWRTRRPVLSRGEFRGNFKQRRLRRERDLRYSRRWIATIRGLFRVSLFQRPCICSRSSSIKTVLISSGFGSWVSLVRRLITPYQLANMRNSVFILRRNSSDLARGANTPRTKDQPFKLAPLRVSSSWT